MSSAADYEVFSSLWQPKKVSEIGKGPIFAARDAEPPGPGKSINAAGDPVKTSRRRRLWELPHKYHCPLIGICFDVAELRKIIGKELKYPMNTTDYTWHTVAVGICDTRCSLSEQLNRLLDRRFSLMIRRMATCKTPQELCRAWREVCREGVEIPAALWAVCTHPACNTELEETIHGDVHMIQHHVGAGVRLDLKAMKNLQAENRQLRQALDAEHKRHERQQSGHLREIQEMSRQILAQQTELSAHEAHGSRLQAELDQLRTAVPDLHDRQQLHLRLQETENRLLVAKEREKGLEREIARLRDSAAQAEEIIESLMAEPVSDAQVAGGSEANPGFCEAGALLGKCVLCVGGRSGSITSYREVVEQSGGRFMHHDGGREESLHRIDGALAAADIVVCQAGCISHGAYWRVKEQCKRTGKPCLFLKNVGTSSFERVISEAGKKTNGMAQPGTGAK